MCKVSRVIIVGFWLVVLSLMLAIQAWEGLASEETLLPIKIGITMDLSGLTAESGRAVKDGAIMSLEQWNKNGGIEKHKIDYVVRDNANDPTKATTIAKEFLESKVVGVCGAVSSTVGIPEMKIFAPAQIPVMGGGASTKLWDAKGPDGKAYYFSFVGSNPVLALCGVDWAARRGYKKLVIIYVNTAWTKDLKDLQIKFIKNKYGPEYGIEVVETIAIDMRANELSREVAKIKALKPDAVVCNLYAAQYVPWFRACNDFDYHPPSVGYWPLAESTYQTSDPTFLYNFTGYGPYNPEKPTVKKNEEIFKARFGYDPVGTWVSGYDMMNVLLSAIKAVSTKGPAIRDWIAKKAKGMPIVSGNSTAICRFEENSPYFYSNFYPQDAGLVYINKVGKMEWQK